MTRTGPTSRLAAVLVAALLFVAACGTDGGDDGASPAKKVTTTTAAPHHGSDGDHGHDDDDAAGYAPHADHADADTEDQVADDDGTDVSASAEEDVAVDEAGARRAVESVNLTIDDVPEGWTAEPDDGGGNDNVFDTCAGDALDLDQHTVAKDRGLELTKDMDGNAQLMIQTATGYLDDLDPAGEMIEILSDPEFVTCSTDGVIDSNDNPEIEITGSFKTAEGLPELGDGLAGLQGDFTVAHGPSGVDAHLGALLILVRTGPLVTAVTATAVDTPGDEQLLYGLLDTIAERQADAVTDA